MASWVRRQKAGSRPLAQQGPSIIKGDACIPREACVAAADEATNCFSSQRPSLFEATFMPRTRCCCCFSLHTGSQPGCCFQLLKASKRQGSQRARDPDLSAGGRSALLTLPRRALEGRLDKDDGSQFFAEFLQHDHPLQEHLVANPIKRLHARQKRQFSSSYQLPFPPLADSR